MPRSPGGHKTPLPQFPLDCASAVRWGTQELTHAGIDEPRLNAELLLAHSLALQRSRLVALKERVIRPEEWDTFCGMIERRSAHEPAQYITGETEFMGLRIIVQPGVLIPRPETEHVVEEAERALASMHVPSPRVLDIGTGTGNIAVALAARLPALRADALDSSRDAILLARQNVDLHKLGERITLIEGDCFRDDWYDPAARYHAIVANPPYISVEEFGLLPREINVFEPPAATTDYGDGLSFYRRIAMLGRSMLAERGAIVVEIAYNQGMSVRAIFTEAGYGAVRTVADYAGHPRVVVAGA